MANSTDQITGTVSDGFWTAELIADRAIYQTTTNTRPFSGRHTMAIPGVLESEAGPARDGFGSVRVDALGSAAVWE